MIHFRPPKSIQPHLRRAFAESFFATFLCGIVVGIVFLPKEIERSLAKPFERVQFCTSTFDGEVLFSLVDSIDVHRAKEAHSRHLVRSDFSTSFRSRVIFAKMKPQCICVDASNGRLFVSESSGMLFVIDASRSTPTFLVQLPGGCPTSMVCSGDGRSVVVQNNFGLSSWSFDSQFERAMIPSWNILDESIGCYALMPDSEKAIFGRTSKEPELQTNLFEVDMRNGESRLLIEKFGGHLVTLVVSPDSRYLVGVDVAGNVLLYERSLAHSEWLHVIVPGLCTGTSTVASFSPDSRLLVTTDRESLRLLVWDLERKEMRSQFEPQKTNVLGSTFLKENEIVSWGFGAVLKVWSLDTVTHSREINL